MVPPLTIPLRLTLRRTIGLLAAYVLALQTILAGVALHVAPQATASTDIVLAADAIAIICLSTHGGGTDAAQDIPGGHGTSDGSGHCALCLSSPPPLLVPQDHSRLAICAAATTVAKAQPLVRAPSASRSRPGGARAPPATA